MRTVHPRGCGEPFYCPLSAPTMPGSSPRVRGTRDGTVRRRRSDRFIPAGAGNPYPGPSQTAIPPVHPRGCGEPNNLAPQSGTFTGSSPRVRGTPVVCVCVLSCARFIPAGAGNPRLCASLPRWFAVHPRGCGEPVYTSPGHGLAQGSSPRVRGTPPATWTKRLALRFIPAGAGNPNSSSVVPCAIAVHPRGCGEPSCCKFLTYQRNFWGQISTEFTLAVKSQI